MEQLSSAWPPTLPATRQPHLHLTSLVSVDVDTYDGLHVNTLGFITLVDPATSVVISGTTGLANPNDVVSMTCTSSGGKPSPTLSFQRDGSTLVSGNSPLPYSFTAQTSDDGAEITCDATNIAGTVSDDITFQISGILQHESAF